jgi:hypothetical protein
VSDSDYAGNTGWRELERERDALRAIVDALPRCEWCESPATRYADAKEGQCDYGCDEHQPDGYPWLLPYASALRAYEASK